MIPDILVRSICDFFQSGSQAEPPEAGSQTPEADFSFTLNR
jgi:hypothetical protein